MKKRSKTLSISTKKFPSIAVVVLNLIQYETIQFGLAELKKHKIPYDLYVPKLQTDSSGFGEMYDETYSIIKKRTKVAPLRFPRLNYQYKILLAPYNLEGTIDIAADYRVRFQYGFGTKPYWGLKYETNLLFDFILCYGEYDQSFYQTYADTRIVGFIKHALTPIHASSKNKKKGKKKILYLPTYGQDSSLDSLTENLAKLQDTYDISVKLHHGTEYLENESERRNKVRALFQNVYTSKDDLATLLLDTDVVISDRSGAVFDAISLQKSVVVYSHKIDTFYGVTSLLDRCIHEKTIMSIGSVSRLKKTLESALSANYKKTQKKLKNKLFPVKGKKSLSVFLTLMKDLLTDTVNEHRAATQKDFRRYITEQKTLTDQLLREKESLSQINNEQKEHLNKIYTGRVWKLLQRYFYMRDKIISLLFGTSFKNHSFFPHRSHKEETKTTHSHVAQQAEETSNSMFQSEIDFWDRELSLKGDYPKAIINRSSKDKSKAEYPEVLEKYAKKVAQKLGKKSLPVVLDVGSGPLSQLSYGHHANLIHLYCADPLARAYYKLHLKYGYYVGYPILDIPGEELHKALDQNTFDIVWMHNAIDHSQDPALVLDSMTKILKPGGYLILQMWSYEGKAESYVGLHQHDFFVGKDRRLYLTSRLSEDTFSDPVLVENRELEVIEKPTPTPQPKQWIRIVWRKK